MSYDYAMLPTKKSFTYCDFIIKFAYTSILFSYHIVSIGHFYGKPPNTPCSRPRWRGRQLGASRGRKLRCSRAISTLGVIVAIYPILPPLDGEHPQFARARCARRESRFTHLPAERLTVIVRLLCLIIQI